MALSPALHPLNVFRSAKVRTMFRLVKPLGLGSGLAGLATIGFCAVALSVSTIRAGNKELSAMEALARRTSSWRGHNTAPPPSRTQAPATSFDPEQNPSPKKNICVEDGRRKYPRRIRKSSFKPVESDQFQIGPRTVSRADPKKYKFSVQKGV